ncbi:hypothetical protein MHK_005652 [Candidatus Magnetomorum sp. HK-1]|nr:hypothetical protein MHK_005652 [Candidatus Magnetomorum sp. HK-1]
MSAFSFQSTQISFDNGYPPFISLCFSFRLRKPGHRPQRFLGVAPGSECNLFNQCIFSSMDEYLDACIQT